MQPYNREKGTIGAVQQIVDSRYSVLEPLGSGGMAEVYLAHDEIMDRDVALKVLSRRYADDEEFVERFRREAQSAARLSHPNIVCIFDRGESDERTYYIAMEYLTGGTLKERILLRGAFPPRTAVAVTTQIAEALEAAHQDGIVHRDVKPDNILITESGDVKVTDFGIARAASSSKMTNTGTILGTAHYVSPEQAMGDPVGPQSDLYSLGVVLYEMLTGEPPYDADNPLGIAMKHVNGHLRPPREIDPSIPQGINAVTVRLLAKDPEDRYPDAASLLEDLHRLEKGLAPTAATKQALSRSTALTTGHEKRTFREGAVGVPSSTSYRDTPHRERQRRKTFPWIVAASLLAALALTGAIGWALGHTFQERNAVPVLDVPSLVGMTLEEAENEVGGDFDLKPQEQTSDEPEGTILVQDPKDVEKAEKGTTIGVVISSGDELVRVPDVGGQGLEEASRTLQEAGLAVDQEYVIAKSGGPQGKVIGTDPPAGSEVETGTSVALTISSGAPEETSTQPNTQQPVPTPQVPSAAPASWFTEEQPALWPPAIGQPTPEQLAPEQPTPEQPAEERKEVLEDREAVREESQGKAMEVLEEVQKGAENAREDRIDR
jgi:eukaryotic-like serine/threonine-protein kinase